MIHVRKKMKGNALVESFGALIVRLPQGAKDLRILEVWRDEFLIQAGSQLPAE